MLWMGVTTDALIDRASDEAFRACDEHLGLIERSHENITAVKVDFAKTEVNQTETIDQS